VPGVHDDAVAIATELTKLRRAIHAEPEIGLDLPRTQRKVLDALDGLPLEITLGESLSSVTAVLRRSGVAAPDIQTSGLSIYPNYSSSSGVPRGYQVSEQLTVTLRRLSTAGSQISAAARAGGNATTIDGVSLNLSDTSTLLASARAKAVADAKAKAAAYARALGRPLGPVISMSEGAPAQPFQPVPYAALPSPSRAASSVPVHSGTQQLSVTVTVVFGLA